jgi:hypothetical protein
MVPFKVKQIATQPSEDEFTNETFDSLETRLSRDVSLENGGRWFGAKGSSNYTVAIIVPYRDRLKNLKLFLNYMHIYLSRQGLVNYVIYLVEPHKSLEFNRALLINAGFLEAINDFNSFDCFIFHDVDMLPESDVNIYKCDDNFPKQFAISISIYAYS